MPALELFLVQCSLNRQHTFSTRELNCTSLCRFRYPYFHGDFVFRRCFCLLIHRPPISQVRLYNRAKTSDATSSRLQSICDCFSRDRIVLTSCHLFNGLAVDWPSSISSPCSHHSRATCSIESGESSESEKISGLAAHPHHFPGVLTVQRPCSEFLIISVSLCSMYFPPPSPPGKVSPTVLLLRGLGTCIGLGSFRT